MLRLNSPPQLRSSYDIGTRRHLVSFLIHGMGVMRARYFVPGIEGKLRRISNANNIDEDLRAVYYTFVASEHEGVIDKCGDQSSENWG